MTAQAPVAYKSLSPVERREVRERYVKDQGGLCMWCKMPLNGKPIEKVQRARINWGLFPTNFRKYPVHLQHCHKTGMTEGAVHMRCNAFMWQYHGR